MTYIITKEDLVYQSALHNNYEDGLQLTLHIRNWLVNAFEASDSENLTKSFDLHLYNFKYELIVFLRKY